jgi:hypothetical protein
VNLAVDPNTNRLEPVDAAMPVRILVEELEPTMRRNGSGPEVARTVVHVEGVELPVSATVGGR